MGRFIREHLPEPVAFFEVEGVVLKGAGPWKTGPCHFHSGSDSLRVHTNSGGWICMACGIKGGDVLSYAMQRHNLDFVEAARRLGAYQDDGRAHQGQASPAPLPARAAMELAATDLQTAVMVISDVRSGKVPSDADWRAFLQCTARVAFLAEEYR